MANAVEMVRRCQRYQNGAAAYAIFTDAELRIMGADGQATPAEFATPSDRGIDDASLNTTGVEDAVVITRYGAV